jgi:hypothetical protein
MTEPLLLGLALAGIALTIVWLERDRTWPVAAGLVLAAACLTRYEAWPITAAAIVLSGAARWRRNTTLRASVVACLRLAVFPAMAVLLFLVNSRWTVGAWFVSGGFFVPENTKALGHPLVAYQQVSEGLHQLSGTALVWSAYAGAILTIVAFARSVSRASLIVLLAPAAAAALPWMAYLQGHPFRIRYDVPLVAAAAACCAVAGTSTGPHRTADRRIATGRPQQRRAASRDYVPRTTLRRPRRDDEHGITRTLHAGSLQEWFSYSRLPARRQRRSLEFCDEQPASRGRLGRD